MRPFILSISAFLLSLAFSPSVFAAETPLTCQPIFGGGTTCSSNGNLLINKTIKHPSNDTYLDSLHPDTPFSPNQDITFRITVTNNNNSTLSNVTITDTFPTSISFTKGDGIFDTSKRTLTIKIDKLAGNETRSYTINARISGQDAFPTTSPLTCLANQVQVKAGSRQSTDNVQFCVKTGEIAVQGTTSPSPATTNPQFPTTISGFQKPSLAPAPSAPVTETNKGGVTVYPAPQTTQSPNTGPELLGLIGLLPLGATGLYLRRKTTINK